MQRVIREKAVDRSSYVAYAGAGAAIAFIAAMTFGAIDAPRERGHWTAETGISDTTRVVSAAQPQDDVRVR